ncbi:MAG: hypothetical protein N2C14_27610, partial [Planctomycetales bacterium]
MTGTAAILCQLPQMGDRQIPQATDTRNFNGRAQTRFRSVQALGRKREEAPTAVERLQRLQFHSGCGKLHARFQVRENQTDPGSISPRAIAGRTRLIFLEAGRDQFMRQATASICLMLVWTLQALGDPVDFVRDVRPILQQHCHGCHGENKQKSGLRLDVKSEAFKGGEQHGASIVPGKAKDSPLIQFTADPNADPRMPPKGKRLLVAEVETLTRWVNAGAVWPDGIDAVVIKDRRDHWSFKPLANPTPPKTRDTAWPRHDVDRFILAKLEGAGLRPAPEADRASWLRR